MPMAKSNGILKSNSRKKIKKEWENRRGKSRRGQTKNKMIDPPALSIITMKDNE
jgi:hypothetical protein